MTSSTGSHSAVEGHLVIAFVLLSFFRVIFASALTRTPLDLRTKITLPIYIFLTNIISAVITAIFGFWVIYAIIFQATDFYYFSAVIETILLLSIALSPGYFLERHLLSKQIPDKSKRSKLALISASYMLLLSLALTYSIYSVEMGPFLRASAR